MELPKVGNVAPAFSLQNQNSEMISLKEFNGKKNIILYFYPKASTPGCTVQACGIRDSRDDFAKLDALVLGVSPDAPSKLKKFVDKNNLNFDLLADEDHADAEAS